MRINLLVFLFVITLSVFSQSKAWHNDLVVDYKMTDKIGKLQNCIVVKKDTLHYQWFEKEKISSKTLIGDTALENKLIAIMDKYKILKFKSVKPRTEGSIIVFAHTQAGKKKTILLSQNVKAGSKEEVFIKEFLEAIFIKVFAQEIKNFPK